MKKIPLYAFYFPNWHQDPRNDEWHGKGWTEWEVLKKATPRFPGHRQPKIPLWGYQDESDPRVMEQKIDTALQHGVDGFLWDMYWFEDGSYRLKALENGFFGAKNNEKMKIALMWCNHDPIYVHPASRLYRSPVLMSGDISRQAFVSATDYFINNYFTKPNYIRIDDAVYFILWDINKLIAGFGGVAETKSILDDFRQRVAKAGLGRLRLDCEIRNVAGYATNNTEEFNKTIRACGIDGVISYGWPHGDSFPERRYEDFAKDGQDDYVRNAQLSDVPVSITVSTGWDSSPRTVQSEVYDNLGFPFCMVTTGNTAKAFEEALVKAKQFAQSNMFTGNFITISTWNEWTEGNYLEPDEENGYGFLEAIKRVFGQEL